MEAHRPLELEIEPPSKRAARRTRPTLIDGEARSLVKDRATLPAQGPPADLACLGSWIGLGPSACEQAHNCRYLGGYQRVDIPVVRDRLFDCIADLACETKVAA